MRTAQLFILSCLMLLNTACSGSANDDPAGLIALDKAYVSGWKLQGTQAQETAIMSLLTDDAVIMPGMGTDPSRGHEAIRGFWFPEGGPPTNTIEFEHNPSDIRIDGDLGVISGRYNLHFEYDGVTYTQEGNYLTVARRQENGDWLASRLIWNDRRLED